MLASGSRVRGALTWLGMTSVGTCSNGSTSRQQQGAGVAHDSSPRQRQHSRDAPVGEKRTQLTVLRCAVRLDRWRTLG